MPGTDYKTLIENIRDIAKYDYEKIESTVNSITETTNEGIIESNAFDKYIVINNDITDHSSEEFKKIRGRKAVYVFKMISKWDVPEDFNRYMYCAKKII